ncbi:MAG: hypothetical protein LBR26_12700 [Prevotella sp.]|nr:hypothetical protein [Prevotella sp.]
MDKITGRETSPTGAPTLPGLDHSSSPGKNGSTHVVVLDRKPRAGAAKAEVRVSPAMDLFSFFRYEVEGKSFVIAGASGSSSAWMDTEGIAKQKNKAKSISSFVFICL